MSQATNLHHHCAFQLISHCCDLVHTVDFYLTQWYVGNGDGRAPLIKRLESKPTRENTPRFQGKVQSNGIGAARKPAMDLKIPKTHSDYSKESKSEGLQMLRKLIVSEIHSLTKKIPNDNCLGCKYELRNVANPSSRFSTKEGQYKKAINEIKQTDDSQRLGTKQEEWHETSSMGLLDLSLNFLPPEPECLVFNGGNVMFLSSIVRLVSSISTCDIYSLLDDFKYTRGSSVHNYGTPLVGFDYRSNLAHTRNVQSSRSTHSGFKEQHQVRVELVLHQGQTWVKVRATSRDFEGLCVDVDTSDDDYDEYDEDQESEISSNFSGTCSDRMDKTDKLWIQQADPNSEPDNVRHVNPNFGYQGPLLWRELPHLSKVILSLKQAADQSMIHYRKPRIVIWFDRVDSLTEATKKLILNDFGVSTVVRSPVSTGGQNNLFTLYRKDNPNKAAQEKSTKEQDLTSISPNKTQSETTSPPPKHQVFEHITANQVVELLGEMTYGDLPSLVINLDVSCLVALVSELAHCTVDQLQFLIDKEWFKGSLALHHQVVEELNDRILYRFGRFMKGVRKAVVGDCAFRTFWRIVNTLGSEKEHERACRLFGFAPKTNRNILDVLDMHPDSMPLKELEKYRLDSQQVLRTVKDSKTAVPKSGHNDAKDVTNGFQADIGFKMIFSSFYQNNSASHQDHMLDGFDFPVNIVPDKPSQRFQILSQILEQVSTVNSDSKDHNESNIDDLNFTQLLSRLQPHCTKSILFKGVNSNRGSGSCFKSKSDISGNVDTNVVVALQDAEDLDKSSSRKGSESKDNTARMDGTREDSADFWKLSLDKSELDITSIDKQRFLDKLNRLCPKFSTSHLKIFGTGDRYEATTFTANNWVQKALRHTDDSGIFNLGYSDVSIHVHGSRSLAGRRFPKNEVEN